jgi:hypothetical protein
MNAILDYIKKLLSESGEVSTIRVMSISAFLVGAGIAIYGVIRGTDLSGLAQVCGVFIGSAFAAKSIQKFAEKD